MEMHTHKTATWVADTKPRPIPSPEQQMRNRINFELFELMGERREYKRLAALLESRQDRYKTTIRRLIRKRMVRVCRNSLPK
jgi:hypothetical protein